jgi:dTDP-glucose pyrophosphorylase
VTTGRAYVIHRGGSLREALLSLDASGVQIVLVTEADGRLVGTVTDGDVRRALLAGATLDSPAEPHMKGRFTTVAPGVGRSEVLDLMRARGLSGIPIVDGGGRVVGLHLLHEIVGAIERPNWAVVMAGGQGTRLKPLTERVPKPMLPVAGRPILERLLLHLLGFGIRRVFLAIRYLGHTIEDHFGDGTRFGCQISYLREDEAGGSGGALSLLPEVPTAPLLVMNGDLVTQADIGAILDFHERGRFKATVGLRPYQHRVPYGCVEVADQRIVSFDEKPMISRLINAGIYVLTPDLPARVPRSTEYPMPALLQECLDRGEPVGGFLIEDEWMDVGHGEQLKAAREGTS